MSKAVGKLLCLLGLHAWKRVDEPIPNTKGAMQKQIVCLRCWKYRYL